MNDVISISSSILSIPRSKKVDAIVVPQGEYEPWRVAAAIKEWDLQSSEAKYLLIAGEPLEDIDRIKFPINIDWPLRLEILRKPPFNIKKEEGVIIKEGDENTLSQTRWVAEKIHKLDLKSFQLHVSPYHIVRWYLTFLKSAERLGHKFAVIPVPTPISMDTISPLSGLPMRDLLEKEVEKIEKYQSKGDAATLPELQKYLAWLWQQPCLL